MTYRRLLFAFGVIAVAAGIAACSGSSSVPTPTPTATPTPTSAPASATTTFPIPQSAGSVTLPSAGGMTPALQFGSGAPVGITMTVTDTTIAPANAPAPSAIRRTQSIAGATPFFYIVATVSSNVAAQYLAGETLSLAGNIPANVSFYVEFDDITASPATKLATTVAGTLSGGLVTFTNTGASGNNVTLTTGHTYLVQFYTAPASSSSPAPTTTPSPSGSATPTPTPTPSPAPSGSGAPTPTPTPTASPSSGPTILPQYTFSGESATTGTITTTSGSAATLPAYATSNGTISATLNFPASTNTSGTMTVNDAVLSAISGTPPFPAYTGSGTVIVYLQFLTSSADLGFPSTPYGPFTDTIAFPGSSGCFFAGYVNQSSNAYTWTQVAPQSGYATPTFANNVYTVTIPTVSAQQLGGSIDFKSGAPFYGAIICQ